MSSMKNRGLVGLSLIGALLIAGCPAPGAPSLPGANNNGTPSPQATQSPTPSASPAGDEKEPNNDFDQAQALTLGKALTASIAGENDDYFKVTIPAGAQDGRLTVTINETSSDFTPYVEVYTSAKSYIQGAGAPDGTTSTLVVTQDVTAGKDYFLKVNGGDATSYTITAAFAAVPDGFERNDTFETAKALTSGEQVDLYLFAGKDTLEGSDVDYFKIDVAQGQTQVKVMIDNNSTAAEGQTPYVELYNPSKEYVAGEGASNAQADLDSTFTVEAAGTYYLKVEASNSPLASKMTVTVQ